MKNTLRSVFNFSLLTLALSTAVVPVVFADDVSAPNVVAPAQPAAAQNTAMTTTSAAPIAAAPQQPGIMGMALPFVIMLGIMYFMMIRPQQKKMKEHQALLGGLKNGDEVITSSGILGTVREMGDKVVTLEVSKNVQLRVLKSQVSQVVKGQVPELQA